MDLSPETVPDSTILSLLEVRLLAAATDRIIPSDNQSAGGAQGGSLAYIVRHLKAGGNLEGFRVDYHTFLAKLEREGFLSLGSDEQDAILSQMEQEGAETGHFFRLFAEHSQEGYYTNPQNWPGIGFVVTG